MSNVVFHAICRCTRELFHIHFTVFFFCFFFQFSAVDISSCCHLKLYIFLLFMVSCCLAYLFISSFVFCRGFLFYFSVDVWFVEKSFRQGAEYAFCYKIRVVSKNFVLLKPFENLANQDFRKRRAKSKILAILIYLSVSNIQASVIITKHKFNPKLTLWLLHQLP